MANASFDSYTTADVFGGYKWAELEGMAAIAKEQQRRYITNQQQRSPLMAEALGARQPNGSYGTKTDRGALGRLTDLAYGIVQVEDTPEYQYKREQMEKAGARRAAARGYFQSPRLDLEMNREIGGLASLQYQQAFDNRQGLLNTLLGGVKDMGAELGGAADFPDLASFVDKYKALGMGARAATGGGGGGGGEPAPSTPGSRYAKPDWAQASNQWGVDLNEIANAGYNAGSPEAWQYASDKWGVDLNEIGPNGVHPSAPAPTPGYSPTGTPMVDPNAGMWGY